MPNTQLLDETDVALKLLLVLFTLPIVWSPSRKLHLE